VRVAGVEVDIAARNLKKTSAMVDELEPASKSGEQGPRVQALWGLGLIGNRGVEQARIFDILMASLHDENENIRYWAVEGLAFLALDASIDPLLDMFHKRSLSCGSRARCLRACAVGHVQCRATTQSCAHITGLCRRWDPR
jgi:hypothetical protein